MTVLNVIISAMEMTARDVQTAATVINAKDANIVARKTAGAVQIAATEMNIATDVRIAAMEMNAKDVNLSAI